MKLFRRIDEYRLIKQSGIFDDEFYLFKYPDVRRADLDPLWHFVSQGWREGRNPSAQVEIVKVQKFLAGDLKANENPVLQLIKQNKHSQFLEAIKTSHVNPIPAPISQKPIMANIERQFGLFLPEDLNYSNKIETLNTPVDIILPIYNGYDYLNKLLSNLYEVTDPLSFRLIAVDDCSSDERIAPLLSEIEMKANVKILRNKTNLGFVQSVNLGAKHAKSHFVILNTDVELPQNWLRRLIEPIIEDDTIASTTPFSNAATICSFPVFNEDNSPYLGMDASEIDAVFAQVNWNLQAEIPTGVGFCMGVNYRAWIALGGLDSDHFGRGYGEENDWCRRAVSLGYRNVHVNNLYVWHKHGGSFASDEKKALVERNLKILNSLHPDYHSLVASYIAQDPTKDVRSFAQVRLMLRKHPKHVLFFDHTLGGGANQYSEKVIQRYLSEGYCVLLVTGNQATDSLDIEFFCSEDKLSMRMKSLTALNSFGSTLKIESIFVNELVGFLRLNTLIAEILYLKKQHNAKITYCMHDFYCICPSLNLINKDTRYCGIPATKVCDECLPQNVFKFHKSAIKISKWREIFGKLLSAASDILCYSEDSLSHFKKAYPEIPPETVKVIPHTVEDRNLRITNYDIEEDITVGIIGALNVTKGLTIVKDLVKLIKERALDVKIVLIGITSEPVEGVHTTGYYTVETLPEIIEENKVNVCLFPSIWPETFSYVTSEIMTMDLPLVSFDLGAQGDKVRNYERGMAVKEISAEAALQAILELVEKERLPKSGL